MKNFFRFIVGSLAILPLALYSAQTADLRMYCLSLKFARGTGVFGLYKLDFTGVDNAVNGELYPVFNPSVPSHFTSLILTDESDQEIPGNMFLDVPVTDLNGDGFADIFDTSLGFSGTSSGHYDFPTQSGSVTATWSRNASSASGTCQLNFQSLGTFTHTFTVLEYRGPLTYVPASNVVSASVNLTLTSDSSSKLLGPIVFKKSDADPHNELEFQSGSLTNEAAQSFPFLADFLSRDQFLRTNYYGFFSFEDWNQTTSGADYNAWVLSIDDRNDTDADTIPDFSDDLLIIPLTPPVLALRQTVTNFSLTINGSVGQVCEIQETTAITSTNWPTVTTVTLTNASQTVFLPLSSNQTKFWRVHLQ